MECTRPIDTVGGTAYNRVVNQLQSEDEIMNGIDFLRHHLATMAFRAQHAISDAPANYPEFEAGQGVLKPVEILNHINLMLVATRLYIRGEEPNYPKDVP